MLYQINMQAETLVHVKASFQIKFRIESSWVKSYKRMFRGGSIEVEQGYMVVTGQHVVLEEKVKRIYMARLYSRFLIYFSEQKVMGRAFLAFAFILEALEIIRYNSFEYIRDDFGERLSW